MFLSIIIPCFNEEAVITLTLNRLDGLLNQWVHEKKIEKFELILVDDGSQDNTHAILHERAAMHHNLKIIRFSRNFGHQAALIAGYTYASGDAMVTLDADLQDPPELIATMLKKLREGFDIVYAVRKERKKDSFFKRASADLFYRLMGHLGVRIIANHADFRMVTKKVLREFLRFREIHLFIRATFSSIGFSSCMVYYERPERMAGKTKYTLKKMIEFAIEGITSFSIVPLRLCTLTGFFISLIAAGFLVWGLIVKISGHSIRGWASTVIPLYLLGGVQLIFLGVVGEYIAKIYIQIKDRPRYIVDKTYNIQHGNKQDQREKS